MSENFSTPWKWLYSFYECPSEKRSCSIKKLALWKISGIVQQNMLTITKFEVMVTTATKNKFHSKRNLFNASFCSINW